MIKVVKVCPCCFAPSDENRTECWNCGTKPAIVLGSKTKDRRILEEMEAKVDRLYTLYDNLENHPKQVERLLDDLTDQLRELTKGEWRGQ